MTIGHENAANLFGALSALLRAGRAAGHRHVNEMGAAGTAVAALKALQYGDCRPSDLAARLHVGPSVVSRAIVPLEQDGLIERKPDPKDARACQLSLTPLGRERLDTLQAAYVERVRARFADWSDADAVYATTVLAALESALDDDQVATDQAALTRSLIPAVLAADRGSSAVETERPPAYAVATSQTDQN
jgi:DNA-binding MarR family transcriptional regulator